MAQAQGTPAAGVKSSELYVMAGSILSMVLGVVPEKYSVAVAVLAGVYTACRTGLKALHAAGLAGVVPDLPEVPQEVQTALDDRGLK